MVYRIQRIARSLVVVTACGCSSASTEEHGAGGSAGSGDASGTSAVTAASGFSASTVTSASGADASSAVASTGTGATSLCDVPDSPIAPDVGSFDQIVLLDHDLDAASFDQLLEGVGPGTVLVRPSEGVCPAIHWGDAIVGAHTLPRPDITFFQLKMTGALELTDGTTLWSIRADPFVFNSSGDRVTIRDSYFSGGAGTSQAAGCVGNLYHQNVVSDADGWLVERNTFANYANREEVCADDHSEALYLGERTTNWIIRGNTFDNNGSTGHIFFTWWYCNGGYAPECDPVNVCVEDNVFLNVINQFGTDIQARQEFDGSQSVYIDPAQAAGGSPPSAWIRPCP